MSIMKIMKQRIKSYAPVLEGDVITLNNGVTLTYEGGEIPSITFERGDKSAILAIGTGSCAVASVVVIGASIVGICRAFDGDRMDVYHMAASMQSIISHHHANVKKKTEEMMASL